MRRLFWARVAYHRLQRCWQDRWHPLPWATERGELSAFPITSAAHSSPLQRAPTGAISSHTQEKIHNLQLATEKLHRLIVAPGEVFSFCRTVGKTDRRTGYLPALELHDGEMQSSVGGGLCQLSNLLLLLALDVNAEIIERHRHSYDLFRDVERSVPFGCGATVFYNYVDFQFRNTLDQPILLEAEVSPPLLVVRIHTPKPLPFTVRIIETNHRFYLQQGHIYRANCIWREVTWHDSRPAIRELLFENCCRVRYPADDLVEATVSAEQQL